MNSKLLGTRLKQAREMAGLTQEELASLVKHDQRSISQWERGLRKLPAVDLPRFAEALKVPLLFFYEGQIQQSDLDTELLKHFHRLPTYEAQKAAVKFLNDLSDVILLHHK